MCPEESPNDMLGVPLKRSRFEGVPLLEENELLETTEGSNSSVSGGDTGSATYSEASSKT